MTHNRKLWPPVILLSLSAITLQCFAEDRTFGTRDPATALPPAKISDDLLPRGVEPLLTRAASEGISKFLKLVDKKGAARFGFNPDAPVPKPGNITQLQPIEEQFVDLATLKGYSNPKNSDDVPTQLIVPLEKTIVPLAEGGLVRTSVTLVRDNNADWKAVGFNSRPMIAQLMAARQLAAKEARFKSARYSIVNISGVNLSFLGVEVPLLVPAPSPVPGRPRDPRPLRRQGSRVYLVPIVSNSRLHLTAGVPRLANDIFADLRQDAEAHNGKPT